MAVTSEELATLQVPAGASFRVAGVEEHVLPHPYCIGSKHVVHASDHFTGTLGEAAIRDGEKKGIVCETCRKNKRRDVKVLSYDEHEKVVGLVVVLANDAPKDLNDVPGLHAWLLTIKDKAAVLGVTGFLFPRESQHKQA